MAVKPEGRICEIREQIIEDPVTGLSFQFIFRPDTDAPVRLVVHGALPGNGNREFLFDSDGNEAGAGTGFTGVCRPTWLQEVPGLRLIERGAIGPQ
jgi:hypothetical protein